MGTRTWVCPARTPQPDRSRRRTPSRFRRSSAPRSRGPPGSTFPRSSSLVPMGIGIGDPHPSPFVFCIFCIWHAKRALTPPNPQTAEIAGDAVLTYAAHPVLFGSNDGTHTNSFSPSSSQFTGNGAGAFCLVLNTIQENDGALGTRFGGQVSQFILRIQDGTDLFSYAGAQHPGGPTDPCRTGAHCSQLLDDRGREMNLNCTMSKSIRILKAVMSRGGLKQSVFRWQASGNDLRQLIILCLPL